MLDMANIPIMFPSSTLAQRTAVTEGFQSSYTKPVALTTKEGDPASACSKCGISWVVLRPLSFALRCGLSGRGGGGAAEAG